jgi:hypothetical protein
LHYCLTRNDWWFTIGRFRNTGWFKIATVTPGMVPLMKSTHYHVRTLSWAATCVITLIGPRNQDKD